VQSWWEFQQMMGSGSIWIVDFYTPWCQPCVEFAAEYKKTPMALEGVNLDKKVRLAAVNCAKQEEVCNRAGIRSYPSLRMYSPSSGGYETYNSNEKSARGLAQWVLDSVESPVVDIHSPRQFQSYVDRGKDLWIVDFFSPNCGPCQAIKGDVRRMANKLKGLAKVAMFSCVESDAHMQLCNQRGVNGYPTIMAFGRGAVSGAKQGVELDVKSNDYPAINAMSIAATILELNQEGSATSSSNHGGSGDFDRDDI